MVNLFILDTNVILYDPYILSSFKRNDVIIPLIVLEELDKFKKGHDAVNLAARTFIRNLNKLTGNNKKSTEFILGKTKGILKIDLGTVPPNIPASLNMDKNDNKIIATALGLTLQNNTLKKYDKVIFVTNDINLKIKARALDINVQEYEVEKVSSKLYQGFREVEITDPNFISKVYKASVQKSDTIPTVKDPIPNEFYIVKSNTASLLLKYSGDEKIFNIVKPEPKDFFGLSVKNVQQLFALDALLDPRIPLVTITGAPGSGKTLLSLAAGLFQHRHYPSIKLCKTTNPVGRDLGFLPGDLKEKMAPHLAPFYDNLSYLKNTNKVQAFSDLLGTAEASGVLEIASISYMRGRSINQSFFILDEAQNATPHELKTVVTRMGHNSKLILLGDIGQIDAFYLDTYSNGLTYIINRFKGNKLFAHVNLVKSERSELAEVASNLL